MKLITGTIGQKAGFTETLDTQIQKILNTTATALKRIALDKKPKPQKGRPAIRNEEFLEVSILFSLLIIVESSTSSRGRH
jgi:RNA12 protein